MKQEFFDLMINTNGQKFYEFTNETIVWIKKNKLKNGMLNLSIHHTSASLIVQENADPDVQTDLINFYNKIAPMDNSLYIHTTEGKDDMPAHIKSSLTNNQINLSIKDGRMAEDYFHSKIMERNIEFNKNIRFSDSIQGFFGNVPQGEIFNYLNKKTNDFSLFFDQNCIILYDIKLDCDIEIIIDNKLKHIIKLKANVPYFLNLLDSFKSFNIKYNNINEVIEYPEDSDHDIKIIKEND